MRLVADAEALRRMFAGSTEQTFLSELGVAEPEIVDYVSEMLVRFVHRDAIFAVRSPRGRRLEELAEMMIESERTAHKADKRREIFRHMGDFALFWTGVYPELLQTRKATESKDSLVSYFEQGKRSYYMASTFSDDPYTEEAPVLRRLSEMFEVFAYGLNRVRSHWEECQASA